MKDQIPSPCAADVIGVHVMPELVVHASESSNGDPAVDAQQASALGDAMTVYDSGSAHLH